MEQRNAIVTGASHGIGQYIARALAARQMNLLLVARSGAELARLAAELGGASKVSAAVIDLGAPQAAQQVADAAAAELTTVDILVNNAATEPQTRFHMLTPAEIEHVLHAAGRPDQPAAAGPAPPAGHARARLWPDRQRLLAGRAHQFPAYRGLRRGQGRAHRLQPVLHSDYRRTGVSATSLILGPVKDAGISARTLAETGLTASAAFSVSPARVAAATVRAIDKPKPETIVSVGPGRALKALMDYFPGLGPRLNRLSGADKLMTAVADYREAMAVDDVGGGLHRAAVMGGTQSGHVEQLPSESLSAAPTAKAPYAIFTASCPEQSTRPSAGKPGRVGQASHLQPSDHPGYLTLRAAARLGAGICGHRTATTSP